MYHLASSIFVMFILNTSIYEFSVNSIEGPSVPLSDFEERKILIITLPLSQTAAGSSFLFSLDSLANAYSQSLEVIAVPSIEDGYTESERQNLMNWYRTYLDTSIIVTAGMYTRASSGSNQHPLFQWLTHADQNNHFSVDVAGPNMKFLIRTNGKLFGVLGPEIRINGSTIHSMLQN